MQVVIYRKYSCVLLKYLPAAAIGVISDYLHGDLANVVEYKASGGKYRQSFRFSNCCCKLPPNRGCACLSCQKLKCHDDRYHFLPLNMPLYVYRNLDNDNMLIHAPITVFEAW